MYKLNDNVSLEKLVDYGFSVCHDGNYIRTNNIERYVYVNKDTRIIKDVKMILPGCKKPLFVMPKTKKYIKDLIDDGVAIRV